MRTISLVLFLLLSGLSQAASRPVSSIQARTQSLSATVFKTLRPAIAVLRTTLQDSEQDSFTGSAFLVDDRGRAITNYHVVSHYLLSPDKYKIIYQLADGSRGDADVVAIDVLNDLAVVALKALPANSHRHISLPATNPRTNLGDTVFAIGNPLDLGLTISTGSYSGVVAGTFDSMMHFTGPLNAGMSGGPAVNGRGELIGVNVAHALSGEAVGFLVPAVHAARLYQKAMRSRAPRLANVRSEISKQLSTRKSELSELLLNGERHSQNLKGYSVPIYLKAHTECTADSNESTAKPPPILQTSLTCSLKTPVMPIPDIRSGYLVYRHTLFTPHGAGTANAFQLAAAATTRFIAGLASSQSEKMSRQRCIHRFTEAGTARKIPVRMVWCTQGYVDFPGLYDFQVAVATQDREDSILVSRLALEGADWATALKVTRRLLEDIQ